MEKYIHLDYAHGYNVAGKQSPDGRLQEWKWAREYGEMLRQALIKEGYKVYVVVPEDREPTLSVRVQRANKFYRENPGQHIFISLHCDAFGESYNNASGMSVRVGTMSGEKSKRLATKIVGNGIVAGVMGNRSVPTSLYWQQDLYVCNKTAMPAVLIEHGFMTNRSDEERLLSAAGKEKLIEITVNGINKYFDSL